MPVYLETTCAGKVTWESKRMPGTYYNWVSRTQHPFGSAKLRLEAGDLGILLTRDRKDNNMDNHYLAQHSAYILHS